MGKTFNRAFFTVLSRIPLNYRVSQPRREPRWIRSRESHAIIEEYRGGGKKFGDSHAWSMAVPIRQQMRWTTDVGQRTFSWMIVYDIIYVAACAREHFLRRWMPLNVTNISSCFGTCQARLLFLGTNGPRFYLQLLLREGQETRCPSTSKKILFHEKKKKKEMVSLR